MKHPYLQNAQTPVVLAHRGLVTPDQASAGVAENSFAAVANAHAAGALFIESDCHLTSDGVVVLFHDTTLERVTGDPRPIADVSERELTELMADRGGIITLQQALEAFPTIRFNIDVKSPAAAEPAGAIIAKHADRVLVTSFSDENRAHALAAAGTRRPATSPGQTHIIKLLLACALGIRPWQRRLFATVDAIQIPQRSGFVPVLTNSLIRAAHRNDVAVHVWTINDRETMEKLIARGVDGIVTDRADIALELYPTGSQR